MDLRPPRCDDSTKRRYRAVGYTRMRRVFQPKRNLDSAMVKPPPMTESARESKSRLAGAKNDLTILDEGFNAVDKSAQNVPKFLKLLILKPPHLVDSRVLEQINRPDSAG